MIYAKCYQRGELFNFYAMDDKRVPVGVEVVCFLNKVPSISYNEYDPSQAGDLIEVEAIANHYQQIIKEEYQRAYSRATAGEFKTYLPQ